MSDTIRRLSDLMSPAALKLVADAGGEAIIQQIGLDVLSEVVFDVLIGRNLRDSTEALTRRRIAALNLALLNLFLQGMASSPDFVEQLPHLATDILASKRLSKTERWLAQWSLGLTGKAVQNVLRDDYARLADYRERYMDACREIIASHTQMYGSLNGALAVEGRSPVQVDWRFMTYLMSAVGAQTLTIRGSEKSAYGKLFEKLILGALLSILGFRYVASNQTEDLERVFWLSSRGAKRDSDATLLYQLGKGVRFDIGFIGRGNSEISLDKVSRFERAIAIGRTSWFMATIVLVDRIPARSRIEQMAADIGATIIQMSGSYWPQRVSRELYRVLAFEHELTNMVQTEVEDYLRERLTEVPLKNFIEAS
jgi:hypothetical protein